MKAPTDDDRKIIATNRRARFEYEILDTFEAGLVLFGPEVKSLRAGKASLVDSYAMLRRGELYLQNLHIAAYGPATRENANPTRERKLLMHRAEILRVTGKLRERGFTLVPLRLYFRRGRAKIELGLARGKKRYDKRETIKKRDADRELGRSLRGRGRSRR